MRRRYIFDRETQKMVPEEEYYAKKNRQVGQAPSVIQDSMDAVRHPCTGQLMDSKSEFRKVTRAHGCTEVGNDRPAPTQPKPRLEKAKRIEAIKYAMAKNGVKI